MHAEPGNPLLERLPARDEANADRLLESFLEYVTAVGLSLYPAQEEAILELFSGKNVILNTPTGSGKSLVATALHFKALAEGKRAFYTAPIKALVSEKFFALCRELGPENVGMMTGDASVNRDAPIVCCTAEILMNLALREGEDAEVDYVVMDEFHFYAEPERGVAWQVPLLTLPQSTFLLMSATLGDTKIFLEELERRTGKPAVLVRSDERPVPLDFQYRETPLHETIGELFAAGRAPIYLVHFTQRAASEQAQALTSLDFLTKEEKFALREALSTFRFDSAFGKDLKRYLGHGIGVHHAGLLPKYRLLVEKLAQKGLLKIVCGTDTLGVGVNIPIRTVVFTRLCKYDGEKTKILSVRDFRQISGRAGRKGYDDQGSVVVQAPEHVIENKIMRDKTGGDPKKLRKLTLRKPPERGYAHWDEQTFERLITAEPERLESRFHVGHGMMLNVLARPEGGCQAMKRLIRECHDGPTAKHQHARQAISMFRSLVEAGVLELVPKEEGVGKRVQVHEDLQSDFSLHQALSLYVVETIGELSVDDPDYALDLLTLVESILENPDAILLKQLDKVKGDMVRELKEAGVEYDDRMAELENAEYPKPRRDFVYATFNAFAARHPWVGSENVRPKSIAREMYEEAYTFREYVKEYGLQRSEGLLLRYLSDAYKALVQTVPESAKTDEVYDLSDWLGAVVRQVDSSLLDEWEKMRDPERVLEVPGDEERVFEGQDITSDRRAFRVLVRNEMFRLVKRLAAGHWTAAAEMIDGKASDPPFTPERLAEVMRPYFEEYEVLDTGPAARAPANLRIDEGPDAWLVEQVLCDAEDRTAWVIEARVDLARAREEGGPVLEVVRVGV